MRQDPRRDVHGDPADIVADQFALSSVDADADLDSQRFRIGTQRLGTTDRVRRSLERGEMAVAGAHSSSTWLMNPDASTKSVGPSPNTWYARLRSPHWAYFV